MLGCSFCVCQRISKAQIQYAAPASHLLTFCCVYTCSALQNPNKQPEIKPCTYKNSKKARAERHARVNSSSFFFCSLSEVKFSFVCFSAGAPWINKKSGRNEPNKLVRSHERVRTCGGVRGEQTFLIARAAEIIIAAMEQKIQRSVTITLANEAPYGWAPFKMELLARPLFAAHQVVNLAKWKIYHANILRACVFHESCGKRAPHNYYISN